MICPNCTTLTQRLAEAENQRFAIEEPRPCHCEYSVTDTDSGAHRFLVNLCVWCALADSERKRRNQATNMGEVLDAMKSAGFDPGDPTKWGSTAREMASALAQERAKREEVESKLKTEDERFRAMASNARDLVARAESAEEALKRMREALQKIVTEGGKCLTFAHEQQYNDAKVRAAEFVLFLARSALGSQAATEEPKQPVCSICSKGPFKNLLEWAEHKCIAGRAQAATEEK